MTPVIATVRIAASPAQVFPFFVDPALMVRWLGDWADLQPEVGGTFAVNIDTTPVRGSYVEVDAPHRVVFTWGVPGREGLPPGSTTVEITLTEDGDATLVELRHYGLPDHEFNAHRSGWMSKLEHVAEALHGHDAPAPAPAPASAARTADA